MAHAFTTLRHPVEKLLEAEHFLARMSSAESTTFQYELNAFLSACRSVTFLLQEAFSRVPGFNEWYAGRRTEMGADEGMRFFLKLRNLSQKAGPVSWVGGGRMRGGWTRRFVHGTERVPASLQFRDIPACCAEQLQKVATVVAACAQAFPYEACPVAAFTVEGQAHLGYTIADAERAVGLPDGYSDVPGFDDVVKLHYLARELEALDRESLIRMAAGEFRDGDHAMVFVPSSKHDLVDDIAALIDPREPNAFDVRTVLANAFSVRAARADREQNGDNV